MRTSDQQRPADDSTRYRFSEDRKRYSNRSHVSARIPARLLELLLLQPSNRLTVLDDEGLLTPGFVEKMDELWFQVHEHIHAETLHQLCFIGSACETDPKLPVEVPRPADKPEGA